MAKLNAKRRNALPTSEFALPKQRKYPVDTRGRAGNAKARAAQMWAEGKLSTAQREKIDAAANKKLKGR